MDEFLKEMERSEKELNNNNSNQSRGQNALQRRAQQLKRWNELQENEELQQNNNNRRTSTTSRVQFSSATLFLSAVSQNDIEECERLLQRVDCDVNVTTGDGLTALHQMSIDDNKEMVEWLLRHNADVNCRDNEGWTPLHASASCGHLEIVKLLLCVDDCDVFAINCDGELARDVCDGLECLQAIEQRMRREWGLTTDDHNNNTELPEDILSELRRKELILVENDFKDFLQKQELNEKSVKEWIEWTRDPQSRASVIHVCAAKGYNQLLEEILEKISDKIDMDSIVDCDGFTPLHASAFWQQMSTFETLLKFGANFELKTRDSRLISDLCHENPKIMELISETKTKREIEKQISQSLTGSETQRRLNAKRQRESRRSTQGVAKEDIEMALKTTKINVMNDLNDNNTTPPPIPSSPPPMTTTATITLPLNDENGQQIVIHSSLAPQQQQLQQQQQRRRQKRRSTGITDMTDSDDNRLDDVFVATSHDTITTTDDNNDCVVDSSSILSTSTPVSTTTTSTPVSRSSSRTSSVGTIDSIDSQNDVTKEATTRERQSIDESEKDYKKLYKELLKENEFLIKKIKDFENNRKYEKEFQEFQREKRQLIRRISELEEELKVKEDLKQENLRLKDENSALIRVISKLSK